MIVDLSTAKYADDRGVDVLVQTGPSSWSRIGPDNRHYEDMTAQNITPAAYVAPKVVDPEPGPEASLAIEKGLYSRAEWLAKVKGR